MVCPVQHDPTARPTLRLLAELLERWPDPYEKRAITEQRWDDVQPLSRLSHPILVKSRSLSEAEPVATRIIECSRDLRLMKVRASQWRAGVWFDPEGCSGWWLLGSPRAGTGITRISTSGWNGNVTRNEDERRCFQRTKTPDY